MSFETCASAGTAPSTSNTATGTDPSIAMTEAGICFIARKSAGYELRFADGAVLNASARDVARSGLLSGVLSESSKSGQGNELCVTARQEDVRQWLMYLKHGRKCELDESDLSRMLVVRVSHALLQFSSLFSCTSTRRSNGSFRSVARVFSWVNMGVSLRTQWYSSWGANLLPARLLAKTPQSSALDP
jgi:hypothetical protein